MNVEGSTPEGWRPRGAVGTEHRTNRSRFSRPAELPKMLVLATVLLAALFCGCVSDEVGDDTLLTTYQHSQVQKGPQLREDTAGENLQQPLGVLTPDDAEAVADIKVVTDPNTGRRVCELAVEGAIASALANSPEVRVISFDAAVAREEVTEAAAEFDITGFGRTNFEQDDVPVNQLSQPGQSESRLLELGLKQKGITGAEWSASYILTRSWDDLAERGVTPIAFPTRYEPVMAFQVKQPLLRDGWERVNLAQLNVSRLRHRVALASFRQRAEAVSAEVIAAYWLLQQARRDVEIQRRLLARTRDTLSKLQARAEIDATAVQIKQTEAAEKARQGVLLQAQKAVIDVQDALLRLVADPRITLIERLEITPVSRLTTERMQFNTPNVLAAAMQNNPDLQRSRLQIAIAEVNIDVAENQRMPRLDLVGLARAQGLEQDPDDAHDVLGTGDYFSYGVGLTFEYPLGNRQREAQLRRRMLERSKAVSALQNAADQVAVEAKKQIRRVDTNYDEIQVQKEAVAAARMHLEALEEAEEVRPSLTPEFLLVKLQAQESLANAERSQVRATVDYNISLVRLRQVMGNVLQLYRVKSGIERAIEAGSAED